MYYANHGYEYVICGMETLDLILLFAGSGLAWKKSETRNETVNVVSKVKCTQLFCHQFATN